MFLGLEVVLLVDWVFSVKNVSRRKVERSSLIFFIIGKVEVMFKGFCFWENRKGLILMVEFIVFYFKLIWFNFV